MGQIELRNDAPAAPNGSNPVLEAEKLIRARSESALRCLLEAHEYAELLGEEVWQFALGINVLSQGGLSINDIRWLLYRRLILHALETTLPGEERRTFRTAGAIRFDRRSCFVLTGEGMGFARQRFGLSAPSVPSPTVQHIQPKATIPIWDHDRQELRLGDQVIKCFKTPAPNQELILAAFQEEGWPVHIDDPLPPHPEQDPRRRLHDTINSLNRNQKKSLIRFMGDGSGQGVRWELIHPPNGNGVAIP